MVSSVVICICICICIYEFAQRQVIHNITQGPLLGKLPNPNPPIHSQRTATTPGTLCPTLFEQCVGSLMSHIEFINMEERRDLRFIVLIRDDLKV